MPQILKKHPGMSILKEKAIALTAIFLSISALSCSGHYLKDRSRDFADILIIEVSEKTYGVSAFAGPVRIGLQYEDPEGAAVGLRGGYFGRYFRGGFSFLFFGADYFQEKPFLDITDPSYRKGPGNGVIPFATTGKTTEDQNTEGNSLPDIATNAHGSIRELRGKLYRSRSPFGNAKPLSESNNLLKDGHGDMSLDREPRFAPAHRYTGIGVSLGLYYGLRVEINAGEILDFILGFATIDWMLDDEPLHPLIRKLKKHPMWDQLDSKTKKELMERAEKGELILPGL